MSLKKIEFKKAFASIKSERQRAFDNVNYSDEDFAQNLKALPTTNEGDEQNGSCSKDGPVGNVDEKTRFLTYVIKCLNHSLTVHVKMLENAINLEDSMSASYQGKRPINRELLTLDYEEEGNLNTKSPTKYVDNFQPEHKSSIGFEMEKQPGPSEHVSSMPNTITSITLVDEAGVEEGNGRKFFEENGSKMKNSEENERKNQISKLKNEENVKIKEKRRVMLRVVSLKVGEIDSIHDRFSAELLIRVSWREPSLDHHKSIRKEERKGSGFGRWDAGITLENAIGEASVGTERSVVRDGDGRAMMVEVMKVTGQFFEFMELNRFPFDSQDLTVNLVSEHGDDEVELVVDSAERCCMNSEVFISEQEWTLNRDVSICNRTVTKIVNQEKVICPTISVSVVASRKPQFFMWNVFLIMVAICSMSFTTFRVDLEYPHSRLKLAFILFLTTVTFKFVVNKCLPKISYLTYLDKYILVSMVILCAVCVWHAVVGSVVYRSLPKMSTSITTINTLSINNSAASEVGQVILSMTDLFALSEPEVNGTQDTPLGNIGSILTNCNASITTSVRGGRPPPGPLCLLIDKVAFVSLASVYVIFHVVFVVFIKKTVSKKSEEKSDF